MTQNIFKLFITYRAVAGAGRALAGSAAGASVVRTYISGQYCNDSKQRFVHSAGGLTPP